MATNIKENWILGFHLAHILYMYLSSKGSENITIGGDNILQK